MPSAPDAHAPERPAVRIESPTTSTSFASKAEIPRPIGGERDVGAPPPVDILVVGAGFSATSLLDKLAEPATSLAGMRITLVAPTDRPGPGYAFGTHNHPAYLLNSPARAIALNYLEREAFTRWVDKNITALRQEFPDLQNSPMAFHPRRVFGHYLGAAFGSLIARAQQLGARVEVRRDRVTRLETRKDGRIRAHLLEGKPIGADRAVLTTGYWASDAVEHLVRPRDADEPAVTVVPDHIPGEAMDRMSLDAAIAVLGTSQSALDVVNRLFSRETGAFFQRNARGELEYQANGNTRTVTLCSRGGRIPKVKATGAFVWTAPKCFTQDAVDALARQGKLDFAALESLFKEELHLAGVKLDPVELLDPFRGLDQDALNIRARTTLEDDICAARDAAASHPSVVLQRLLQPITRVLMTLAETERLSAADQDRVQTTIRRVGLYYASPCPLETAERLLALMKAGRLRIIAGTESVARENGAIVLKHRAPDGTCGKLTTKNLINATGVTERDVTRIRDPLVRELVRGGALRPYVRDGVHLGGLDVDPRSELAVDAEGNPSSIHIIGPLTEGRHLLSNMAGLLEAQAGRTASALRMIKRRR